MSLDEQQDLLCRARAQHALLPVPPGVSLGGNDHVGVPWRSISSELEVTALCVRWLGGLMVLVSFDLLYVGDSLRQAVRRLVADCCDADQLFLFASHCHSAPATDTGKPDLGPADPELVEQVAAVVAALVRDVVTGPDDEVTLRVGVARADHSINRRRPRVFTRYGRGGLRLRAIALAPNPAGSTDEQLTAVVLEADGRPVAALWNYACHPVGLPDPFAVSAHYIGAVRDALRAHLHVPTLPVLFLQGFSGDTRPHSPSVVRYPSGAAARALRGPDFHPFDDADYDRWSASLAEVAVGALGAARPVRGSAVGTAVVRRDADDLLTGAAGSFEVAALRLGELLVVGASAEPVSAYATWLRSNLPGRTVMPAGCMNNPIGYLPTEAMLHEGGYEAGGFRHWFPGVRGVAPDVQRVFVGTMAEALAAVGLKPRELSPADQ
jgi:hypothetical protein